MNRLPNLSGAELAQAGVSVPEALAAIESGLAALARNEVQQPHPSVLSPGAGAFFQPLTAALPNDNVACVRDLAT